MTPSATATSTHPAPSPSQRVLCEACPGQGFWLPQSTRNRRRRPGGARLLPGPPPQELLRYFVISLQRGSSAQRATPDRKKAGRLLHVTHKPYASYTLHVPSTHSLWLDNAKRVSARTGRPSIWRRGRRAVRSRGMVAGTRRRRAAGCKLRSEIVRLGEGCARSVHLFYVLDGEMSTLMSPAERNNASCHPDVNWYPQAPPLLSLARNSDAWRSARKRESTVANKRGVNHFFAHQWIALTLLGCGESHNCRSLWWARFVWALAERIGGIVDGLHFDGSAARPCVQKRILAVAS